MTSDERQVRNREQPTSVPVAPMGDVPVIVRVLWSDGVEEWRPARAVRWTRTHVMVGWREDGAGRPRAGSSAGRARRERDASDTRVPEQPLERWVWLRAADVMRSVSWLVAPERLAR